MLNDMGTHGAFIEGDSDVIEEADEHNQSLDNVGRRTFKRNNKSLDDYDGDQIDEPVN